LTEQSQHSDQFDKLTQLAVKICNADAAFISFFDRDRQWFKSKVGFDHAEVPFSTSICQYMVNKNLSYLTIPDLSLDETFKKYSDFTENGIRFYSGFALTSPDDSIIGSFCVFGYQPKQLDDLQLEFLKTMADQTMLLIESHKLNYEISIEAGQLEKRIIVTDKAATIGKLGGLYLDMAGQDIFWSPSNNVLFDLAVDYTMTFEEFELCNFKFENSFLSLFKKIWEVCNSQNNSRSKFSFEYEAADKYLEVHGELLDSEIYVVFQDKSKQQKLTHDLKLYRRLMEQVEEAVNLGGWSYDLNTKEVFWTKNTYAIYELPVGQNVSLELALSHFTSESYNEIQVDFSNLIENGTSYQKEYLFTSAFGISKWVKASGHPIYENDEIVQVVGSFQDITEEKSLRLQLQKSEMGAIQTANYYKSLVNNTTFYICKAGVDGGLTFCNAFYSSQLNVTPLDINGNKTVFFHAVNTDYLEPAREAFFSVASGKDSRRRVLLKETNSNQVEVYNLWDFIALKNSHDNLVEVLCLGYDVSELEKNRAQVQMLADYTSFQNKRILEYNSIVSHDIRSHVANSVGLISLMDIIENQDEYQNYFRLLKKEIRKTDRTIMALDKLSSVTSVFESGKERVPLYQLIEDIFDTFRRDKLNARFILVNKIPEDLVIFSIRKYLENLFSNVISNSLKMVSPEREFQIEIDAFQITNSILQIKIVDNGILIDMGQSGEGKVKIKRPLEGIQYGNGVGLYVIKQQIEALGGQFKLQNENGKGNIIILEFLNHEY